MSTYPMRTPVGVKRSELLPQSVSGLPARFSVRERMVLDSLARGYSNKQIATEMSLSELTVKSHIARMMRKTGARDRTALVVWGFRRSWLQTIRPVIPENFVVREFNDREREVTFWVIRGMSNQEIGNKLFLAEDTVKSHLKRAFSKAGAKNRTHLVAIAWQRKLVVQSAWFPEYGKYWEQPGAVPIDLSGRNGK